MNSTLNHRKTNKRSDAEEHSGHRFYGNDGDRSMHMCMKWTTCIGTITALLLVLLFGILLTILVVWGWDYKRHDVCDAFCNGKYCAVQTDCIQLSAYDLTALASWNNQSAMELTRECFFGKCFYRYYLNWVEPDFTVLRSGSNWLRLTTGAPGTTSFGFPGMVLANGTQPVADAFTWDSWGDPLSMVCMNFLKDVPRDSRYCILPHMTFFWWDNSTETLTLSCLYTYDCYRTKTFDLDTGVLFPATPEV